MNDSFFNVKYLRVCVCACGANVYMIANVLLSLPRCVTARLFKAFWNIDETQQLAFKIPKDERESTIVTHNIKKVHSRGPRSNVREVWGWMSTICEWQRVAGWWESAAADKIMLTYSWLMALVVLPKGHKADGNGLETGSDGWSKLVKWTEKKQWQTLNPNPVTTLLLINKTYITCNWNSNHSTRKRLNINNKNIRWIFDIMNWCRQVSSFIPL